MLGTGNETHFYDYVKIFCRRAIPNPSVVQQFLLFKADELNAGQSHRQRMCCCPGDVDLVRVCDRFFGLPEIKVLLTAGWVDTDALSMTG